MLAVRPTPILGTRGGLSERRTFFDSDEAAMDLHRVEDQLGMSVVYECLSCQAIWRACRRSRDSQSRLAEAVGLSELTLLGFTSLLCALTEGTSFASH